MIHFLTQPELRALFQVITRKRDRACFSSRIGTDYAPLKGVYCTWMI